MPIAVVCSECNARLNAPDAAAGKTLKCPKCKSAIEVPEPEGAPDFEVVDEPTPPRKKSAPAPSAKPAVAKKPVIIVEDDEDEEDEKPRKKKRPVDDDNDTPRSKKRRQDDEEEDDEEEDYEKPRKKKKKKKLAAVNSGNMARNIIGIVVLVVALGIAGFVWWDRSRDKDKEKANNDDDTPGQKFVAGPGSKQGPGPTPPGPKKPPEEAPKDNSPPIEISAEMLTKAYFENEDTAVARYKGKTFIVEGKVNEVAANAFTEDEVFIKIEGGKGPTDDKGVTHTFSIGCLPDSSTSRNSLWALSRGQTVKISGRCAAVGEIGPGLSIHSMSLRECKILKVGPDPTIQIDFQAFEAERTLDPDAFDKKYDSKELTISDALVESVLPKGAGLILVSAKKKGTPFKLEATWISGGAKLFKDVKPGDSIRIKGHYNTHRKNLMNCWPSPK